MRTVAGNDHLREGIPQPRDPGEPKRQILKQAASLSFGNCLLCVKKSPVLPDVGLRSKEVGNQDSSGKFLNFSMLANY